MHSKCHVVATIQIRDAKLIKYSCSPRKPIANDHKWVAMGQQAPKKSAALPTRNGQAASGAWAWQCGHSRPDTRTKRAVSPRWLWPAAVATNSTVARWCVLEERPDNGAYACYARHLIRHPTQQHNRLPPGACMPPTAWDITFTSSPPFCSKNNKMNGKPGPLYPARGPGTLLPGHGPSAHR